MRHRRRADTLREWFAARVADVRAAFEEMSSQRAFDYQLDCLYVTPEERERFKSAVMMFAQVGLTVEEVEELAEGAAFGRVSISGVPLRGMARHEPCRCVAAASFTDWAEKARLDVSLSAERNFE